MKTLTRRSVLLLLAAVALSVAPVRGASAADADTIDREVAGALKALYETTPAAKHLRDKAKAILVFPNIVKAGFIVGAQYGEGALQVDGKSTGYYNVASASYGLQAGVQAYGYALFLMTDSAVKYLKDSHGWEVGVGPTVVLVDEGVAKNFTTTTLKDDVYAFAFGQKGLMAGIGIQGSKITKLNR